MYCLDILRQRRQIGVVGFASSADHKIPGHDLRSETLTYELSELAFQSIAIDRAMLMARHDDAESRMIKRGSSHSDVEVSGPNPLPLSNDGLQVATPRQPKPARKAKTTIRLRRTYPEASQ
jgi:hypothetical protein